MLTFYMSLTSFRYKTLSICSTSEGMHTQKHVCHLITLSEFLVIFLTCVIVFLIFLKPTEKNLICK